MENTQFTYTTIKKEKKTIETQILNKLFAKMSNFSTIDERFIW